MNILMLRHSAGFEHTYLPDAEVALETDRCGKRLERHYNTPMRPNYG